MHLNKIFFLMIFISSLFLINSNNVNAACTCSFTCFPPAESPKACCGAYPGNFNDCPDGYSYGSCTGGETCSGFCDTPGTTDCAQPPPCTDECSPAGSRRCFGSGYQTCGNYDADSCLEWGNIQNLVCDNPPICYTLPDPNRLCLNGRCNYPAINQGEQDPGRCDNSIGCDNPPCECNGAGVCVPIPPIPCTINNYQITPDCSLNDPNCETGEKINIQADYDKDTCPNPSYIQIDASNSDITQCNIVLNLTGNDDMRGITSTCRVVTIRFLFFHFHNIVCTPWTIPLIPQDCLGDTLTSNKVSLYDYNDYSNLITSLTQNDGSFTFTSTSQCSLFGESCTTTNDCCAGTGLVCSTSNTCVCQPGFEWDIPTQTCKAIEVECSLTSAYFSLDGNNPENNLQVNDNTPVSINVKGNDPISCNRGTVTLTYWDKDDGTHDAIPENILDTLTKQITFNQDLASYTWTAQYFDDTDDPQGDHFPDYQFEASIGLISKKISNILEVKNTPYNNENTCSDFNPNAKCEQQCTSQGLECVEQLGSVPGCTNCCICGLTQDFDDGSSITKIYGDCLEDTDTEDQYGTVNVEIRVTDPQGQTTTSTETEQCTLLRDVPVPFFGLLNLLIVALLITIYYILKKKEYI